MSLAAVLNSRQSKSPCGNDAWVVSTLLAVQHAVDCGQTILSRVGLNAWELATWATGACGGRLALRVSMPFCDTIAGSAVVSLAEKNAVAEMICREFELNPTLTEFRLLGREKGGKRKQPWTALDEELIRCADVLYPVALRPGGNLEGLLRVCGSEKTIDERFRTPYCTSRPFRFPLLASPGEASRAAGGTWPFLTHWTRSAHGRWPGETAASYYRNLAQSRDENPRSALATVRRMFTETRIRASSSHVRGGFPVIAFTSLPPAEAVKLMRWRKRFVRWNFEPYGLAIHRDAARALGIRPVVYGVPADYEKLDPDDRPFFQNVGVRGNWTPEHEWRHMGDLDFSRIPPETLTVIVPTEAEADYMREVTAVRVVSLF